MSKFHINADEKQISFTNSTPPLLIYQMGKVGSSSIYKTLKQKKIPYNTVHVHRLSDTGLSIKERWLKYNNIIDIPADLRFFKQVRGEFDKKRNDLDWKVITLTREPVGVEISGIFENMRAFFADLLNNKKKPDIERCIEFLRDRFVNINLQKNHYHNWFDREIKELFDIDVYDYDYGFDKGYSIINKNNISILLIRMEDLDRSFHSAIDGFLGVGEIKLINENTASNKYYSKQYKEILEEFSLTRDVCEKVYSTKYAQHFYTPEEREALILKWTKS